MTVPSAKASLNLKFETRVRR